MCQSYKSKKNEHVHLDFDISMRLFTPPGYLSEFTIPEKNTELAISIVAISKELAICISC